MADRMTMPHVATSWGEVVDKITILEIKNAKLTAQAALANVRRELDLLSDVARDPLERVDGLAELKAQLQAVNEALWAIEDDIRDKEAKQEFDDDFIALARSVYRRNDERAAIKRRINDLLGSEIVEEKSYKSY
jgi:3-methyladenine DNA glycosylase/8-oxoguanine DNA glycosylase